MRSVSKYCCLLVIPLLMSACTPEPEYAPGITNEMIPEAADPGRMNVVVIVIDTLRADHLGAYGYHRETSPFIDEMARNGIVYERAFSTSSYTREAVASLFTGYYPWHGGHAGWTGEPRKELQTLAQAFLAADYETAMFSNSTMVKGPAFGKGFQTREFGSDQWGISKASVRLSINALDWVRERESGKPMFMYVHYLDPHGPYDPPTELYDEFRRTDLVSGKMRLYGQLRRNVDMYVEQGFGPDDDRFIDMIDRYDAEIAHTDEAIRELFKGFQDLGLSENTLFVITSDHGEEFLEHGFVEHAWTVYNESVHVPLIIHRPGLLSPTRIENPISIADIPTTLEALLDIDLTNEAPDGAVLMQRNGRAVTHQPREAPVIAELGIKRRNLTRAVIAGDLKYIASVKWLTNAEKVDAVSKRDALTEAYLSGELVAPDTWGEPVREELFNIKKDFGERINLLESGGDAAASKEKMIEFLNQYRERGTLNPEGEMREIVDEQEIEEMEALGYIN